MRRNFIKCFLEGQDGSKLSQYMSVISAVIVIFTVGIHLGWPVPSLKKLMSLEYPFEVTEGDASYIAIISSVGHVIGGISGSTLSDIIGRKWTILLVAVPQVLSLLLIYFSYLEMYFLYCARILGGIGEGCVFAILPIYIAEVAQPEIRGSLGTLVAFTCIFGTLFINILGSYIDIHTTALICLVFPVLQWLIFTSMPETPYFLLMKNKVEEASNSLRTLRRKYDIDKEILKLTQDVNRQMSESGTYKDLFTIPSNRKVFILVTLSRLFQQFTGCTAFATYYQILLEQSTDLSPVMGSSILMIIQMCMVFLASFFIDRFGRKPLLVFSSGSTFVILLILGIFFVLRDIIGVNVSTISWFPLPMMIIYIITFSTGLGIVLGIYVAELYSTSIKAKALSMGAIVFALTMTASTKFYQSTADNFGLAIPFLSFSACTLVATLFFHFWLPETKGKSLEEIQQHLKKQSKSKSILTAKDMMNLPSKI